MIFSEASVALEDLAAPMRSRKRRHWTPQAATRRAAPFLRRRWPSASVFLAFIFIAYFVEPRDLLRRLIVARHPHRRRHLRRGRHAR